MGILALPNFFSNKLENCGAFKYTKIKETYTNIALDPKRVCL